MQAWRSGFSDVVLGEIELDAADPILGFVSMARRTLLEEFAPRKRHSGWGLGRLSDASAVRKPAKIPCELHSPFESCAMIAGGVVGCFDDDALLKLRFAAGTVDLAMHTHQHSRRVLMVVEGSGFFHVSAEALVTFSGRRVHSVAVQPGDIVAFDRDLMHTFSAPTEALTLLSFHAPFIPIDDERQYTLPEYRWFPPLMMPPIEALA